MEQLVGWCIKNNLSLNIDETKEMIVDFRSKADYSLLYISSSAVEKVSSTQFLGVHITEDLSWSLNTTHLVKKAQQRMHFLRKVNPTAPILTIFYQDTVESVLMSSITSCYGSCSAANRKTVQHVVRMAERVIRVSLPAIEDIYTDRCRRKALCIVKDSSHLSHGLFNLLPSSRRYRSITSRTHQVFVLCELMGAHTERTDWTKNRSL